jgi:hypothetical protein
MEMEGTGPASLAEVMEEVETLALNGKAERLRPIPTGFSPLDEILNGGIRPGELLMIGGALWWPRRFGRCGLQWDVRSEVERVCVTNTTGSTCLPVICPESAERGIATMH